MHYKLNDTDDQMDDYEPRHDDEQMDDEQMDELESEHTDDEHTVISDQQKNTQNVQNVMNLANYSIVNIPAYIVAVKGNSCVSSNDVHIDPSMHHYVLETIHQTGCKFEPVSFNTECEVMDCKRIISYEFSKLFCSNFNLPQMTNFPTFTYMFGVDETLAISELIGKTKYVCGNTVYSPDDFDNDSQFRMMHKIMTFNNFGDLVNVIAKDVIIEQFGNVLCFTKSFRCKPLDVSKYVFETNVLFKHYFDITTGKIFKTIVGFARGLGGINIVHVVYLKLYDGKHGEMFIRKSLDEPKFFAEVMKNIENVEQLQTALKYVLGAVNYYRQFITKTDA